jgi:hypothetical protein
LVLSVIAAAAGLCVTTSWTFFDDISNYWQSREKWATL